MIDYSIVQQATTDNWYTGARGQIGIVRAVYICMGADEVRVVGDS